MKTIDRYWRAANYISVGQIYPFYNSLLREPLSPTHVKPMVAGRCDVISGVVDLMKRESRSAHPHGLDETDYDALFTAEAPIIFAFHGYPSLVHRLTYRRRNLNLHVDRFHLVIDALDHPPGCGAAGEALKRLMQDRLIAHERYICQHGQDMPDIRHWMWDQ